MATETLQNLRDKLSTAAPKLDASCAWPAEQLGWLVEAGVFRWFLPKQFGGTDATDEAILNGYLELSQACLSTTFVLTQWNAACKRILASTNESLKEELLPKLADGSLFATVGISHLTTSRQHLAKPVLGASESKNGFQLDGMSPWVTGAAHADVIVTGATLDDGSQILAAVAKGAPGMTPHAGAQLMALSSSCTDRVEFKQVEIPQGQVIAGPVADVLSKQAGGGAGGLQTSTLAIGLATAAAEYLQQESLKRSDLSSVAEKMSADCQSLRAALFALNFGEDSAISPSDLRQRANSLVLRSTQAALSAAKGAGFLASHPTGRWVREAMFFLVWSCPQPVVAANMCELAQLNS